MVPKESVSVLGQPPFHATALTTAGELSYVGGNWERDIAFAGYAVPLQVRHLVWTKWLKQCCMQCMHDSLVMQLLRLWVYGLPHNTPAKQSRNAFALRRAISLHPE